MIGCKGVRLATVPVLAGIGRPRRGLLLRRQRGRNPRLFALLHAVSRGAVGRAFATLRPAIVAHRRLLAHIPFGDIPGDGSRFTFRRRPIATGAGETETQDVAALDLARLL